MIVDQPDQPIQEDLMIIHQKNFNGIRVPSRPGLIH
jgi:hypothetical protein